MEFDNPERPECRNLLSIYQIITEKTKEVSNFCMLLYTYTLAKHEPELPILRLFHLYAISSID
jgi:hypothetical protein